MLVLVTVTAASAFAVFVNQTQEQRQQAEYAALQRELEKLTINGLEDLLYDSGTGELTSVAFLVSNYHTKESTIPQLELNNNLVYHYKIYRRDGSIEEWQLSTSSGQYELGGLYALDGSEPYIFFDADADGAYSLDELIIDDDYDENEITASPSVAEPGGFYAEDADASPGDPFIFEDLDGDLVFDDADGIPPYDEPLIDDDPDNDGTPATPKGDGTEKGSVIYSDYYLQPTIDANEQIKISLENVLSDFLTNPLIYKDHPLTFTIKTNLLNDFSKTFFPPVAIIQLDMIATPAICDGTKSYTTSDNGYLLHWHWSITEDDGTGPVIWIDEDGPKIPAGFTTGNEYAITLEISDNYGMTSSKTYTFTA